MTRPSDFDLAKALAAPNFTPGRRDIPALVELVVADDPRAGAALAKLDAVLPVIASRWAALDDGARARLVGVIGLVARAGDPAAQVRLVELVADPQPRTRRAAIVALGKLAPGDTAITAVLVARWEAADVSPEERRALVDALGKLGGDAVLGRLRALDATADPELARRRDRAVLVADRDARRDLSSTIAIDRAPPHGPLAVRLECRAGLAGLLRDELVACGFADARAVGDRAVEVALAEPWSRLYAARLWASASVQIPLRHDHDAAAIARAILAEPVRGLLRAWTVGAIRWRLGFVHGHKRAIVWRVARDVTHAAPELINDPTATTWEILVDDDALAVVPRRADDPRFAWRVADVPAASHPTIAAALARVAGARAHEVVWDPFCGSGAELVERARLGPCTLIGTDLDPTALDAARANLAAANVTGDLALADARTAAGPAVDLVITNPPLGSRVHVDAAMLLVECLPHFARRIAPGGRLVWLTPAIRRTTPVAEAAGLRRATCLAVDLGGVRGHLERWDQPSS